LYFVDKRVVGVFVRFLRFNDISKFVQENHPPENQRFWTKSVLVKN
jgi:hypothetical protein